MVITVEVVCEGYLRKENNVLLEAHSTATLIVGGPFIVLVDTTSPHLRNKLISGLHLRGLDPQEDPDPGYRKVREDFELMSRVRLFHTPGHTRGSMSVEVDTQDSRYVIAGDALPTKDNFDKWVTPGIKYDEDAALRSMETICYRADIIVPGHGAPFPVDLNSRQR
jgi:glyoxylase-like metal-dependent hydrolase (beta-lactamase superfamily II)